MSSISEIEWFRSCYALPKCSQVQRLMWGLIDLCTNNGSIVVLVHVDYPCQLPYLYFVIRKRSRLLIVLVLHRKPLLTTESTHNRRKRFINVPPTWQKLFPWFDCLTKTPVIASASAISFIEYFDCNSINLLSLFDSWRLLKGNWCSLWVMRIHR